jgi:hypothetical protein
MENEIILKGSHLPPWGKAGKVVKRGSKLSNLVLKNKGHKVKILLCDLCACLPVGRVNEYSYFTKSDFNR